MDGQIDSDDPPNDYVTWSRSPRARRFRPDIVDSIGALRALLDGPWSADKYDAIATALELVDAVDTVLEHAPAP